MLVKQTVERPSQVAVILFLDASAFIKLYVVEPGSGPLRRALKHAAAVFALDATYVEVRGALAQAIASGMLRETVVSQVGSDFERDWQGVHAVVPDAAMVRRASLPSGPMLQCGDGAGAKLYGQPDAQAGRPGPQGVAVCEVRIDGIGIPAMSWFPAN